VKCENVRYRFISSTSTFLYTTVLNGRHFHTDRSTFINNHFLQGVSIAAFYRKGVSPSVRPSVTPCDSIKKTQARITVFSQPREKLLPGFVTCFQKFERGHPDRGREMRGIGEICDFQPISPRRLSQKRCEVGPRLLLIANRKSHKPFRLLPKSTTLNDLERPYAVH